ncbi:hypothetical protein BDV98DRAFT_568479 [Pterulicium gracile]|uniref:C2H2-type domain-containing protein n=1 Tax=Pterulicium gracile TaxID=1884261 RepID=A0A5C3QGA3_9AGAR|nr:hypothetical protein BDV98DRAFT_568479 [Pterula gracilis]
MSSAPRKTSSRSNGRKATSTSVRSHKKLDVAEARRQARCALRDCPCCTKRISYTNLARHIREKHDLDLGQETSGGDGPGVRVALSLNRCYDCQKHFTRPASLQRHCNQKHDGLGIASPASTADASMESIQSTSGLGSDTASISSEASSTPAFTQAKDSATEAGIPPMDMAYGLGASMHTGSQVDMNVGSQQAAYLDGSYESEMDMGSGYRNQAFSGPSEEPDYSPHHDRVFLLSMSAIGPRPLLSPHGVSNDYPFDTPYDSQHQAQTPPQDHSPLYPAESVASGQALTYRRSSFSSGSMHSASYSPRSNSPTASVFSDYSRTGSQPSVSWFPPSFIPSTNPRFL